MQKIYSSFRICENGQLSRQAGVCWTFGGEMVMVKVKFKPSGLMQNDQLCLAGDAKRNFYLQHPVSIILNCPLTGDV